MNEKIRRILEILQDEDIENKHFILYRVLSELLSEDKEKQISLFRNTVFMLLSEHTSPIKALDILGNIAKDILEMYPELKKYFEANGGRTYIT